MNKLRELFQVNERLLTFRATQSDFKSYSTSHLYFGLFCTWLVGIGRWWDDPNAEFVQRLGVGSVAYIFVLATIIWLLVLPLKPRDWSYKHVVIFISFTSLPALLYAIPVEQFTSIGTAVTLNMYFLAVVAIWRVSLLVYYLIKHAALPIFYTLVVTLLPIVTIVVSLALLNLHKVVFNLMGGLREHDKSPHDGEYGVLILLSILSFYGIIPLLISYVGIVTHAQIFKKRE